MSAEWTNPHTTHLGLAAVTVPFSSCLLFLFFPPPLPCRPLSFFPFEELFKNLGCVCVFFFLFWCQPRAHKRPGNYQCGKKPPASFPVYTHKASHLHTSPHTHLLKASPVFISQCKQTKNNYTAHIGLHITPTSGQGGLDIFETRPSECLISQG